MSNQLHIFKKKESAISYHLSHTLLFSYSSSSKMKILKDWMNDSKFWSDPEVLTEILTESVGLRSWYPVSQTVCRPISVCQEYRCLNDVNSRYYWFVSSQAWIRNESRGLRTHWFGIYLWLTIIFVHLDRLVVSWYRRLKKVKNYRCDISLLHVRRLFFSVWGNNEHKMYFKQFVQPFLILVILTRFQ